MDLPTNINTMQKLKTWKSGEVPTQSHVDEAKHWLRHNIHRPISALKHDEYVYSQKALVILSTALGQGDYKRFLKSLKKPTA